MVDRNGMWFTVVVAIVALVAIPAVGVADSDQQMRDVIAAALEDQAAKLKGPFEIVYSSDSPGDNRWRPGVKRWRYVVTPETLFWDLTMDERSMYQKSSLNRASGVLRSLVGSPEISVRQGLTFSRGYIARAYAGPMNSLFSNNLAWTERDFAAAVRMGTVSPEQEAVDGFQCWRVVPVVAKSPHKWTLWLDPKIGYSPRKLQWDHEDSSLAPVIWKLTDYNEVSPGIWFPSVMHARGYDPEQKKIVEREYRREAVHLDKTYSADELEIVFPSESEVEDTIRDMIYTKP